MRISRLAFGMILIAALGACENKGLRTLQGTSDGPDEFIVTPVKPLEQPASYNDLPPPTPGQSNRVELEPLQDGAAALGGARPTGTGGPIPGADAALVAHATRGGVSPTIREELAAQDADFRKRRGRLTQIRIVPVDRYNQVYRNQALDAGLVAEQYRARGVPTPAAPPVDRRFNPT